MTRGATARASARSFPATTTSAIWPRRLKASSPRLCGPPTSPRMLRAVCSHDARRSTTSGFSRQRSSRQETWTGYSDPGTPCEDLDDPRGRSDAEAPGLEPRNRETRCAPRLRAHRQGGARPAEEGYGAISRRGLIGHCRPVHGSPAGLGRERRSCRSGVMRAANQSAVRLCP